MSDNSSAFLIDWDTKRFSKSDIDYDGFLMPFNNYKETQCLSDIDKYQLPENIYIESFFDLLAQTDYPMIDLLWPIFSNEMYSIITACGSFPHITIPVTMINAEVETKNRFDKNGTLNANVGCNDFKAIQLTSFLDVFDYEKSDFLPDEIFPEEVGFINNLVLKNTAASLPPLFRIEECLTRVFISAYAKDALEQNGVKGVVFKPLTDVH